MHKSHFVWIGFVSAKPFSQGSLAHVVVGMDLETDYLEKHSETTPITQVLSVSCGKYNRGYSFAIFLI